MDKYLTVNVSHVDKLIGDDIISVMSGPRSGHGEAVDVEASSDYGEDGHEQGEDSDQQCAVLHVKVFVIRDYRALVPWDLH